MPSTKPLDIVILSKDQDGSAEDLWKPYQEYGEKTTTAKGWSCYILAKEGELFLIRCKNTTEKLLAVRISVDACFIQQYLLRPTGEAGDIVTYCGTGSHSMTFGLVSALTRAGNRHSRLPSETGCISITAYKSTGPGGGLPPPEKPAEQLELPVSMDGTLWELCARFTGSGLVLGEPSPHAAEIGGLSWTHFATMSFNYRTEDELYSGRIRGISFPQKPVVFTNLPEKRKRPSLGSVVSKRPRDRSPSDVQKQGNVVYVPHPSNSNQPEASTSTISTVVTKKIKPLPVLSKGSSPTYSKPKPGGSAAIPHSGDSVAMDLEPSGLFVPWPLDHTPQPDLSVPDTSLRKPAGQPSTGSSSSNPPAVRVTRPGFSQPQPQPSLAAPAITPPPTPYNHELEQPTVAGTNEDDHLALTLTAFLDEVSHTPLGFLAKDFQKAGISTVEDLKIIARRPEAFRKKISVLADLREREEFSWMMFRKGIKELLKDQQERPAKNLVLGSDPIGKFVHSLNGGGFIDPEEFADGLRRAGISSERDLLVLSHNLEKYTENIPFLREFSASKKIGWVIFQLGLEDLSGRKMPTSTRTQDHETNGEGGEFIKHFLNTIDPDKPLGYLTNGFTKAGLTNLVRLICVAEDMELALDAMPFLRGLASGDQLVWAMILVKLNSLVASA